MPSRFLMPSETAVKSCTTMIYGMEPELRPIDPESLSPFLVASYVDDTESVVAQCVCDIGASASLACALSIIPIPTAQEMISTSTLSPIAEENFREVMNIFSSLFMDDKSDHLTLSRIDAEDSDLKTHMQGTQTVGYEIADTKYPGGKVLFTSL